VPGRRETVAYVLAAVSVVWFAGSLPRAAQPTSRPPIDQLVRDLQAKYDSVRDFAADFEHSYAGGLLSLAVIEHGTVEIKKPGKMRWRYATSEEKLYISDGETFYSYFPLDRQVIVTAVPPDDRASTAALFLAGKGSLSQDFSAAYDESDFPPNAWVIRLTPRGGDVDYEWLTVTVDRRSLSITGLSTADYQGGESTYRFSNLEENQGLSDSLFTFTIPDNTDVVTEEAFR
jgi:outer membrane lipoprotein carrier protein